MNIMISCFRKDRETVLKHVDDVLEESGAALYSFTSIAEGSTLWLACAVEGTGADLARLLERDSPVFMTVERIGE
jgi:hypothetical protein